MTKNDTKTILLVILCFILPPLAVYLYVNKCGTLIQLSVLILITCSSNVFVSLGWAVCLNILLCLLGVLPGFIHGIMVVCGCCDGDCGVHK